MLKVFSGVGVCGKLEIVFESGLCLLIVNGERRDFCYEDEADHMMRRWKRMYGARDQADERRARA